MPQKAQLKQFVPPEPTRIESVETLPPALSRTIGVWLYQWKRQSTTVELPLSIREQSRWLRLQTVLRLVDGEKLPSVTNLSANKGNTDGDLRRLGRGLLQRLVNASAGWDYEYDIGFIKPCLGDAIPCGKVDGTGRQTSSIDQSRTKGAE